LTGHISLSSPFLRRVILICAAYVNHRRPRSTAVGQAKEAVLITSARLDPPGVNLGSAKTINGRALQISSMDGKVMIDNARVTETDIMASNGIIHVIDSVVLP
jgi:uncharacterized surface protein with fasciclin (FAS1) repeats